MKLRTVVADDEPLARERLRRLLADDKELELVGECRNGKELVQTLRDHGAELLLLDIEMPVLDGLEAIKELALHPVPMIIFVTAHDDYALEAFDLQALDYLRKPVEARRFTEAIARAKERHRMQTALLTQDRFTAALQVLESLAPSPEPLRRTRFLVRVGSKEIFVSVSEIAWIEAADYYVCLHVGDRKYMLRESIKKLEEALDPLHWIRVHRSAIVNIDHVREIHREGRSEGWTLLDNGERVRMSPQGWAKLLRSSRNGPLKPENSD